MTLWFCYIDNPHETGTRMMGTYGTRNEAHDLFLIESVKEPSVPKECRRCGMSNERDLGEAVCKLCVRDRAKKTEAHKTSMSPRLNDAHRDYLQARYHTFPVVNLWDFFRDEFGYSDEETGTLLREFLLEVRAK